MSEALVVAAKKGLTQYLRILLDKGADINVRDIRSCGETPLLFAIDNNKEECVDLLLERGANPNICDRNNWNALMYAATSDNPQYIDKVLRTKKVDINSKENEGYTALMLAAENGNVESLVKLITCNARLDCYQVFRCKQTALMLAVANNRFECVVELLRAGADPHVVDSKGKTALDWAEDNSKMVTELLKYGATANYVTDSLRSIIQSIAQENILGDIVSLSLN